MRGVVFDLDGTLLDTETLYARAFQAAMADIGLPCEPADYAPLAGLSTPARSAALRRRFGPAFPEPRWRRRYYEERERLLADGIPLCPGTRELLEWLDTRDIPRAAATAASRATAARNLTRAGLAGRFRRIVTRDDVKRPKPDGESFRRAAALLGFPPASCIAVEDSAPGIAAALDAGMGVIALRCEPPLSAGRAGTVWSARDLHHARVLIAEILEQSLPCNVQPAA